MEKRKFTEEHKKKLSLAMKGRKLSEEHKKKISVSTSGKNNPMYGVHRYGKDNPFYGKHHTKETIARVSEKNKNKKLTEEHKKKISVSTSGKDNPMYGVHRYGKDNPMYIDGRTPLVTRIRKLEEYKNWRDSVYKRDNYLCQECYNTKSTILNAHHKKDFNLIFEEFINEYPQFSVVDDKEVLVRLAITYKPFWDINNGATLCVKCHTLTKNFKKRVF